MNNTLRVFVNVSADDKHFNPIEDNHIYYLNKHYFKTPTFIFQSVRLLNNPVSMVSSMIRHVSVNVTKAGLAK